MKPRTKAETIKAARANAKEYIAKYGSCSQSTLRALQDAFGMKEDAVYRAATGLTGGVGGMDDVCGSLLGAVLMMGMVFGRGEKDGADKTKVDVAKDMAGMLYKWFQKANGAVTCRDLCTRFAGGVYYDRNVPWQAKLRDEAGIKEKCHALVENTAARAAEMIWDQQRQKKK